MTISSFLHWLIWGDHRMSVCGRALEVDHPFWRRWVRFFGVGHCLGSWLHHRAR